MRFSSVLGFRRMEGRTEIIPTQRLSFIFRLFYLSIYLSIYLSSFLSSFVPSFLLRFAILGCDRNLTQILLIPEASQLDYVISGDGCISVRNTNKVTGSNTSPNTCVPRYNQAEPPTRRREKTATTPNFSVMRVDNSQARTLTPVQ
jgi:hypothetical protein